ncbi:hypothetical protein [Terriglobus sp. TAA 43]|uniref:hypothetical protein n=1 Tax=Terriglobus sp. TAA 43 TaxID=278961 RepID=UPI000648AA45|nr:hypothetical protein [Terriglobus sp. TAA 43]
MEATQPVSRRPSLLPWTPLIVAAFASYGPVGWNYGFALYFLNYNHGFVKRGLVGELFSHFTYLTRGQLLLAEYLFLAAAYLLCYVVFRPTLFRNRETSLIAVLLLSAPAALPHIGYLFAQPDVTLFLLLLLCMWLLFTMPPLTAACATIPLCIIALCAHEAFSLMFYPLVVAILIEQCRTRRLPWIALIAHVAIIGAALLAILHFGTLKVSPDTILQESTARTDVGVQRQVYDVMASSFAEQRALVVRLYTPGIWRSFALTFCIAAPYFFLLGKLLRRSMRAAAMPSWQQAITCLLFLSPLMLCYLGHDFTRWIGAACMSTSLFILALAQTNTAVRESLTQWTNNENIAAWLAYLIAAGPMGATGIRSAELLLAAWSGR